MLTAVSLTDAWFELASTGNFGNGSSTNTFSYVDARSNTYARSVSAVNTSITSDHQSGTLAGSSVQVPLDPDSTPQIGFARPRLPGHSVIET